MAISLRGGEDSPIVANPLLYRNPNQVIALFLTKTQRKQRGIATDSQTSFVGFRSATQGDPFPLLDGTSAAKR